jgi:ribosomal protein S18 acetylase RimI-like enzyme
VSPPSFDIERLDRDGWAAFRDLRIAALTDSPDAFSPTSGEARSHDDAYWQRAALRLDNAPDAAMFMLRTGGRWIGLGSATRDANGLGHIGAMWVHPEFRQLGLGALLLDRGLAFLDAMPCEEVELSVTEGNERAVALYRSRGFELTGTWEPLRATSTLRNLFMRRRRTTRT